MSVVIKPEIYISWIPTGQVELKPLLFATCIPLPKKFLADLSRKVTSSESTCADVERIIVRNETALADLLRAVTHSEKISADTQRNLYVEEKFSADTFRRVVQSEEIFADIFRVVKKTVKTFADTSRKIGIEIAHADILRNLIDTEKNNFDTCRTLGTVDNIFVDTFLIMARREITYADSFRILEFSTLAKADTLIQYGIEEKIFSDTARTLGKSETAQADSFRQITVTEKITADLKRALREFTRADTFRKVNRVERKSADTVIRVPHILNYVVQKPTRAFKAGATDNPSLVNTFKDYGITAFNITLNEKTLSDDFSFETTRPLEIGDAVRGTLLDYHFNFLVEETTQTDLVQTVKGKYNVDDLLYKWFTLTLDEKDFPSANWIAAEIAHYFLLASDVAIDDFTPTNFTTNAMMTYSDVLSSAFGWTSRVPQQQINVFIRGNTLHCIQRGKEHSVFDISDLPHSRPTINKKFNRVLVHNPNNDNDNEDDTGDDDDDDYKFSGTIHYKQEGDAPLQARISIIYTYEKGLLVREDYATNTGLFDDGGELKTISNYGSTTYSYTSLPNENSDETTYYIRQKVKETRTVEQIWNNDIYRGVKETIVTTQTTSTSYNYKSNEKSVYLFHEHAETTQTESNITEMAWTDTYHVPVGNGWYAQTVYRNGIFQGANLSQGAPGNAVSPYTVAQTQENFKGFDIQYSQQENPPPFEDNDNGLSAIVDDSFPVKKSEFKSKLNEALRWLHRKITETVNVDLISPVRNGVPDINHIVDFTERVKLDGNEYFLVSNNISFTPRKLIQKLQMIRWY